MSDRPGPIDNGASGHQRTWSDADQIDHLVDNEVVMTGSTERMLLNGGRVRSLYGAAFIKTWADLPYLHITLTGLDWRFDDPKPAESAQIRHEHFNRLLNDPSREYRVTLSSASERDGSDTTDFLPAFLELARRGAEMPHHLNTEVRNALANMATRVELLQRAVAMVRPARAANSNPELVNKAMGFLDKVNLAKLPTRALFELQIPVDYRVAGIGTTRLIPFGPVVAAFAARDPLSRVAFVNDDESTWTIKQNQLVKPGSPLDLRQIDFSPLTKITHLADRASKHGGLPWGLCAGASALTAAAVGYGVSALSVGAAVMIATELGTSNRRNTTSKGAETAVGSLRVNRLPSRAESTYFASLPDGLRDHARRVTEIGRPPGTDDVDG